MRIFIATDSRGVDPVNHAWVDNLKRTIEAEHPGSEIVTYRTTFDVTTNHIYLIWKKLKTFEDNSFDFIIIQEGLCSHVWAWSKAVLNSTVGESYKDEYAILQPETQNYHYFNQDDYREFFKTAREMKLPGEFRFTAELRSFSEIGSSHINEYCEMIYKHLLALCPVGMEHNTARFYEACFLEEFLS